MASITSIKNFLSSKATRGMGLAIAGATGTQIIGEYVTVKPGGTAGLGEIGKGLNESSTYYDISRTKSPYRKMKIIAYEQNIGNDSKGLITKGLNAFNTGINYLGGFSIGAKILGTEGQTDSTDVKVEAEEGTHEAIIASKIEIAKIGNLRSAIIMPLPNTLRDSQQHGYTEEKGIVGTMASKVQEATMGGIADTIAGIAKSMGPIGNVIGLTTKAITRPFGSMNLNQAMGSIAASGGFRNLVADPGYFQNYTGSTPRTFSFSWELMPTSADEAKKITDIVFMLKDFSMPSANDNKITMLSPYFFKIEIGNPWIQAMLNINDVVIKDISVDYGTDGGMQFYHDGFPKTINLSITVSERMTQYSYNKSYAKLSTQKVSVDTGATKA